MFKDVLLTLPSWPKTASARTLRKAVDIARFLDAHLTGLVTEPMIPMPVAFHPYSRELEAQLQTRQEDAHATAQAQLSAFENEARMANLVRESRIVTAPVGGDVSEPIVELARLRDLAIVPFISDDPRTADLVQALVFEAGRPVLVLPDDDERPFKLDRVVVAWDAGRAATRAVGDALPLLQRAGDVRIVTVGSDKTLPENATGAELATHLARNGVNVTLQEVERGNRSVGEALDSACSDADLLVMGAFGHSRIRDFFLGGATKHMMANPKRPTLLSH